MSHYFTDNRQMSHNRKEISFRFLGIPYTFVTDNGVFCKDKVDIGTEILLNVVSKETLGNSILDLGCGYGVVGVVVKKQYPCSSVLSVDVNPRAVELTKENAELNHIEIRVQESDGFKSIDESFTDIITNPPIRAGKTVVYRFFSDAYEHLLTNGTLWVVIRKQQGAPTAIEKLKSIFGNCEIVEKKKGYFILKSCKNNWLIDKILIV